MDDLGNMVDTNLKEGSYGAIIDKALFDSLLCSQTGPITVAQYVQEVERLLSDTGVFVLVSYGNPEQRLQYLEQYDIDEPFYTPWMIEVQALGECYCVRNTGTEGERGDGGGGGGEGERGDGGGEGERGRGEGVEGKTMSTFSIHGLI